MLQFLDPNIKRMEQPGAYSDKGPYPRMENGHYVADEADRERIEAIGRKETARIEREIFWGSDSPTGDEDEEC